MVRSLAVALAILCDNIAVLFRSRAAVIAENVYAPPTDLLFGSC